MRRPPLDLYRDEVGSGALRPDLAQESAMRVLDGLYQRVILTGDKKPSFLQRLGLAKEKGEIQAGVYLFGPVGRGKTRLMDLFFEALPDDVPRRRVHFHKFMIDVHDFLHRAREAGGADGVDNILPRYADQLASTCRVLCFDEFHVMDVADAMILQRLFTALFAAGIFVVMTSNLAPDDLYKGGLQRDRFLPFIELMKARMHVIPLAGDRDYRTDRLKGRPVFFHPLGTTTDQAIDDLFHDLTDGAEPVAETLSVKGHSIHLPQCAKGVARAHFSDLCERPLAAEDYLAVADAYHTLILEHVPRLTYDRRNETKRFIILVDVLYERGRRLVLSAETSVDRLGMPGDHSFEFQRTLSRLTEMQSASWGG